MSVYTEKEQEKRRENWDRLFEQEIRAPLRYIMDVCQKHGLGFAFSLSSAPVQADSRVEVSEAGIEHTEHFAVNAAVSSGNVHSPLVNAMAAMISEDWAIAFRFLAEAQDRTIEGLADEITIAAAVYRVLGASLDVPGEMGIEDIMDAIRLAPSAATSVGEMPGGAGFNVDDVSQSELQEMLRSLAADGDPIAAAIVNAMESIDGDN